MTAGLVTSVITALATIVLAGLTARYVRLTSEIAAAATAQTRALQLAEQRRAKAAIAALAALANRVAAMLKSLTAETVRDSEVRQFAGIHNAEVLELERLAREVGGDAQHRVTVAAVGLFWILAFVERYRMRSPSVGYDLSDFERSEYVDAHRIATDELGKLDELLRNRPGDSSSEEAEPAVGTARMPAA